MLPAMLVVSRPNFANRISRPLGTEESVGLEAIENHFGGRLSDTFEGGIVNCLP
jgi:hypothetical protein